MSYVVREYDRYVIIHKCLEFHDLKSNERYIFSITLVQNSSFIHMHVSLMLYLHSQNLCI